MITQLFLFAALGIILGGSLYLMYRAVGIDLGLPLILFAMTSTSLLSWLFFVIYRRILDQRYAQIEAQIPYPIFHRISGNFELGGGKTKNGNIYFCDAGIVCVSMEEKPYSFDEILIHDIYKISYDTIHLYIHTKSGRLFRITLPDASDVIDLLKQKDWLE